VTEAKEFRPKRHVQDVACCRARAAQGGNSGSDRGSV